MATRLILVKADGSVSVHADDRAYKPLNWMSPPCTLKIAEPDPEAADALGVTEVWQVRAKDGDTLHISLAEVFHDSAHELGVDPGLQKDGVEAHLQELLAANTGHLHPGLRLVRREYPTDIGPVDLLCRTADGAAVAIEIKRRGEIDGVEQLTRYLDFLNRDPMLRPVSGMFVAQQIKPQAKVLARDRGIEVREVDYDVLRGIESDELRLF